MCRIQLNSLLCRKSLHCVAFVDVWTLGLSANYHTHDDSNHESSRHNSGTTEVVVRVTVIRVIRKVLWVRMITLAIEQIATSLVLSFNF